MAISTKVWLRVAGLSGASAVVLGTYGAHAFHPADDHYLGTFETANKYHFIHSLLIGLAPSSRYLWRGFPFSRSASRHAVYLTPENR